MIATILLSAIKMELFTFTPVFAQAAPLELTETKLIAANATSTSLDALFAKTQLCAWAAMEAFTWTEMTFVLPAIL